MRYKIGIDVGATKTSFILLKNSKVVETRRTVTPKNKKELIAVLKENIKNLANSRTIEAIGLGVTGPLSEERGLMLYPPNQKFLSNFPLAKIISKISGVRTVMENDVNCFALAEALIGAGKKAKTVLGITLGTGLGGGLVIDKKLQKGSFGALGEVGHMVIKFDGPRCTCGTCGCFEEYGSQRFFLRKGTSPKECKDPKIWREYGKMLGIGLGNLANILDPEMIVIGGGISNKYDLFIKEAEKEMRKRILSPITKKKLKLKKAKFGDFAGAIGASLLV